MSPATRTHTQQRLAERYGLAVSAAQLFQLNKHIAHGQARFLSRQSKQVALWAVDVAGQTIRFVFDSRLRSILTALPPVDSDDYLAAKQATPLNQHP